MINSWLRTGCWLLVPGTYLLLVGLSYFYFYEVPEILFILTLPWSTGVAVFGMLIIHASSYGMNDFMLIGAAMNIIIMVFAIVRSHE